MFPQRCPIARNINFKERFYENQNPRPHLLLEACHRPHPTETEDIPTDRHPDVGARHRTEDREHDIEETNEKIEDEKVDLYNGRSFDLVRLPIETGQV